MKSVLKKFFSYEPMIVWIRYFQTTSTKYLLINFGLPFMVCALLRVLASESVIIANLDVLTISSILIGFCSSIIIMLFTLSGEMVDKQNSNYIKKPDISLLKALIYKFSFMIYNLVALVVMTLIINALNCTNLYVKLVSIGILLNTLLILIESLSNAVLCFLPKKNNQQKKER